MITNFTYKHALFNTRISMLQIFYNELDYQ
jgi:hypothetical protein